MKIEETIKSPMNDLERDAESLIEGFKKKLKDAANETIGDIYCEYVPHIETDAWFNFRNEVVQGLCNYPTEKLNREYDFEKIRRKMFEDYREEIIADINQDHINEIESLKARIKQLEDQQYRAIF